MKFGKIISSLLFMPLIVACSSDSSDEVQTVAESQTLPSTEVYVQGGILKANDMTAANTTRASSDYTWPYVNTAEGWETACFFIRVDGVVQDVTDKSPSLYYGSLTSKNNKGRISTLYPYGRYNDRDMDYYQIDKRTGENIGLFRYVYDEKGLKTQLPIIERPKVIDILNEEKEYRQREVDNGRNVTVNAAEVERINAWLEKENNKPGYLDKHALWYVVKEVGRRNGWHVDGVITDSEVEPYAIDATKVPNNVEIDIHQQKHQDWSEIKTSVHVRADVESIKINLPIREDNIVEQDDFAIRVYDYYYKEYVISHTITHNADGITIEISGIPAELIAKLKAEYGDGLTVEIHSYCKRDEEVWADLKNSAVISMGKECELKGQITSALRPDEKVKLYAPKK